MKEKHTLRRESVKPWIQRGGREAAKRSHGSLWAHHNVTRSKMVHRVPLLPPTFPHIISPYLAITILLHYYVTLPSVLVALSFGCITFFFPHIDLSVNYEFKSLLVILLMPCHFTVVLRFHTVDFTLVPANPLDHLSLPSTSLRSVILKCRWTSEVVFSSSAGSADKGPLVYCPTKSLTGCAAVSSLIIIVTGNIFLSFCFFEYLQDEHQSNETQKCHERLLLPKQDRRHNYELNQWWHQVFNPYLYIKFMPMHFLRTIWYLKKETHTHTRGLVWDTEGCWLEFQWSLIHHG